MAEQMTEDQSLLQNAAERYLRDSYDFNGRRDRIAEGIYSDPGQWQAFAEMGWLALPIPEEPHKKRIRKRRRRKSTRREGAPRKI